MAHTCRQSPLSTSRAEEIIGYSLPHHQDGCTSVILSLATREVPGLTTSHPQLVGTPHMAEGSHHFECLSVHCKHLSRCIVNGPDETVAGGNETEGWTNRRYFDAPVQRNPTQTAITPCADAEDCILAKGKSEKGEGAPVQESTS